ncbi:MAG TPA: RNA polymerase sigma factor [Blastocatellia bacterium]|jgi:RNA polymerase sigma factor, sigma-70 family
MVPSDAELLRLMLAGEEKAFTELYRRHKGLVYRFALLMSGQASVAEEVTQEVFLALLRNGRRYDPERGSLKAYLCGAARNQVLLLMEKERPYVQLVEESDEGEAVQIAQLISGADPLGDCARNEANRLVRQAVLALPARYREVIVLCDFQEMSYAEAALTLDCPIGTVNSRLHRGHALLLKKLRAAVRLDSAAPNAQGMRCFA